MTHTYSIIQVKTTGRWRVACDGRAVGREHALRCRAQQAMVAILRSEGFFKGVRDHHGWDLEGEAIEEMHQ